MKRPPFTMAASRHATLRCDGKCIVSSRASFVWETFLMRRAAGVPGLYEIRSDRDKPWHRLDWTIDEGVEALGEWGMFGKHRVVRTESTRQARLARGLPVG